MARKPKKIAVIAQADMASSAAEMGVIDHSSQLGSWAPPPIDAEIDAIVSAPTSVEDEVVAELEALEGVTEKTPVETSPAETNEPQSFDEVVAALDQDKVTNMTFAIASEIDERAAFERAKNPDNDNIHRTLKKVRDQLVSKRAAQIMMTCSVDPAVLLNRSIHDGQRYNVYALGKFADIVFGTTQNVDGAPGKITNAINLACMRSLFRFRAAGLTFTGEMAKAAASDKVRVEKAFRDVLVSHTVSASTAPTQASSTMQALETLGVVRRSGPGKNPTFELTGNPIVSKLEAVLAA